MSDVTKKDLKPEAPSTRSTDVTKPEPSTTKVVKEETSQKTMEITLNTSFGFSTKNSINRSTTWNYQVNCEQSCLM